jgi:hypothetical protein
MSGGGPEAYLLLQPVDRHAEPVPIDDDPRCAEFVVAVPLVEVREGCS